jgi:hypothetical protein
MKMYGGMDVELHAILTSALDGSSQLHSQAVLSRE